MKKNSTWYAWEDFYPSRNFDRGTCRGHDQLIQSLRDRDPELAPSGTLGLVDFSMGTSSVVGTAAIDNFQILAGEQVAGIPGDFDADLDVDGVDFLVWQRGFGTTFNSTDLAKWESNFGGGVGPLVGAAAAAVPEPASIFLFVIGLTWLTTFDRKNCERGFAT